MQVGQLETVVQLQQAELDAAHTEIGALKEHVGCLTALSAIIISTTVLSILNICFLFYCCYY